MIPGDLRIFSWIYECRGWVLIPLFALWAVGGVYFLFRLRKVFFLWLLIWPLFLQPLSIAATYSGWHYRMELYRRFAVTPQGWTNIDVMPPEIRAEYAKHDYHPRFRDIKAKMLGTIVFTPLLFAFGGTLFCAAALAHKAMAAKGRS